MTPQLGIGFPTMPRVFMSSLCLCQPLCFRGKSREYKSTLYHDNTGRLHSKHREWRMARRKHRAEVVNWLKSEPMSHVWYSILRVTEIQSILVPTPSWFPCLSHSFHLLASFPTLDTLLFFLRGLQRCLVWSHVWYYLAATKTNPDSIIHGQKYLGNPTALTVAVSVSSLTVHD